MTVAARDRHQEFEASRTELVERCDLQDASEGFWAIFDIDHHIYERVEVVVSDELQFGLRFKPRELPGGLGGHRYLMVRDVTILIDATKISVTHYDGLRVEGESGSELRHIEVDEVECSYPIGDIDGIDRVVVDDCLSLLALATSETFNPRTSG